MGKKKQTTVTETTEPVATSEAVVAVETQPAAEATPETPAKRKGRKPRSDSTLGDLATRFIAHLEESGKSAGTCASYGLELRTALGQLGGDTELGKLTEEQVATYFACAVVNKTRSGRAKSPLSIAKSQRVFRQLLTWAGADHLVPKDA